MIQRVLYQTIVNGLPAFNANPRLFENLFAEQWGLGAEEVAGIVATFAQKPTRVQHGYAQTDAAPPLVTILMQNETQSDFALGDYVGQDTYMQPDGSLMKAAELGSIYDASFQCLCYTENADFTSYLYEVVKACLTIGKPMLEAGGLMDPMLSGMDLAPDPRYMPEHLFVRALNVRCKRQFIVTDYNNALAAALKLGGLYLPNKTPHTNGGVATNVVPLTESQTLP